ncbi:hypothetical protein F0P96_03950 [Hymenobacter busanensis]|uniref:Immunity protein 35 domain-containing protein n=1 Tax=Hymenobacter busanensis TaxID=2607656 RepID=A0A7L4ZU06_9BACT|nr:YrhB domain-containing protein [Hymenobacter busanensis]KAA9339778.1 hypothetical protein F0P96_03950 [Hymenobacter busanensis]QHJ06467.1 hypothetical protein GUY19_03795 [Hymenobacter busanensis]
MPLFEEARDIAQGYMDALNANPYGDPDAVTDCVLIYEETISRPYGWVFFYASKSFLETDDFVFALIGNAPFIVNKFDGSITVTGTAHGVDCYLAEYEKQKGY